MSGSTIAGKTARRLNFAVTFIGFIDTPLLVPVIALYAASLGAKTATVGLIVGLYSLTNTVCSVFGGRFIDRYGYKTPLIVGLVGDSIGMFAYGLCRVPWHLALVRAFHGACGGLVGPATMSSTAQTSPRRNLGKGMALYGIAIGTATLVGNASGGLVATRLGYGSVFLIGGSLLAIAVVMGALMPKGSRSAAKGLSLVPQLKNIARLLGNRTLALPYASIFAQYFAFGGIVTLLPLRAESLEMSPFHVGLMIGTFALVFILVQLPSGNLSDRIGRVRPAVAGLAVAAMAVAMLPLFSVLPLILLVMALFGLGYGLFFPALSALVADGTSEKEYGMASGIYHALLTVGVAVGAPTMGWVASYTGTSRAIALSSIPLFIAVILAVRTLRGTRSTRLTDSRRIR